MSTYFNFANDSKTILFFPTTDFRWGIETSFLLRELTANIVQNYPVDSNRIWLAGASMGGNGLGDNFPYLADATGMIFSMLGNISTDFLDDPRLMTLFNVPYTQMNGFYDNRVPDESERAEYSIRKLAKNENAVPLYIRKIHRETVTVYDDPWEKVVPYKSGHTYDHEILSDTLSEMLTKDRNLYQSKIWATFIGGSQKAIEEHAYSAEVKGRRLYTMPHPKIDNVFNRRYFWLELEGLNPASEFKETFLKAEIKDNKIQIVSIEDEIHPQKLNIYLSSKLVDFSKPIVVVLDGRKVLETTVVPSVEIMLDSARKVGDPNFLFEQKISIPYSISNDATASI